MMKLIPLVLSLILAVPSAAFAQANEEESVQIIKEAAPPRGMRGKPINLPDISVVGLLTGHVTDDKQDLTSDRLQFEEIETAFQGYVRPNVKADFFMALHKHDSSYEAEICEAKVSLLRIVEGLGAEVGKIHVNFGKLNKTHTHHRHMIDQPPVITNFFGAHGLVAQGGTLSYLLPLPFFLQIEGGAWRLDEAHSHDHDDGESTFSLADEMFTTRGRASFAPTDDSELEFGTSFARGHGSHFHEHRDQADVIGADLTFRFWPSANTRWTFQNEWMHLSRKLPVGVLCRDGMYSFLNYRFNKYFDLGGRFDYAENAFPSPANTIERAFSAIATYHLNETSAANLQYKIRSIGGKRITEGWLRLVFGIGPHSHELE